MLQMQYTLEGHTDVETNHCNAGNKSFIEDLQEASWLHAEWNYQLPLEEGRARCLVSLAAERLALSSWLKQRDLCGKLAVCRCIGSLVGRRL